MDPLTALRQIAFRLERTRASTYRVQAFRTAADVVARMDPKILKARTQAGALHEITGIGEVTGTAITEAVRGEVALQSLVGPAVDEADQAVLLDRGLDLRRRRAGPARTGSRTAALQDRYRRVHLVDQNRQVSHAHRIPGHVGRNQ